LVQQIDKVESAKTLKIRTKSSKSAPDSGEFLPGDRSENQEAPGQIRRFGNPV
jgi:hypothetical protein